MSPVRAGCHKRSKRGRVKQQHDALHARRAGNTEMLQRPAIKDAATYRELLTTAGGTAPISTLRIIPLHSPQQRKDAHAEHSDGLFTPAAAPLIANTVGSLRCHRRSERPVLRFSAFGTEASELMATVQTAMLGNLPSLLRDAIFTHPTAAEGSMVLPADVSGREQNRTARRAVSQEA